MSVFNGTSYQALTGLSYTEVDYINSNTTYSDLVYTNELAGLTSASIQIDNDLLAKAGTPVNIGSVDQPFTIGYFDSVRAPAIRLTTDPVENYVATSDAVGNMSWKALGALGVRSIQGTMNQVLANGITGTQVFGDVILTTPQDLASVSSPQFTGLTLSGLTADTLLYGNASKALASASVGTNLSFSGGNLAISTTPTFSRVLLADGSQANPSLSFTNGGSSGLYLSGTNQISLVGNNNIGLTVDSSGNITIPGNLNVNGTTTTVNSTVVEIKDNIITLDSGNSVDTADSGIAMQYNTSNYGVFYRIAGTNNFTVRTGVTSVGTTISTGSTANLIANNLTGTIITAVQNSITTMTGLSSLVTSAFRFTNSPNSGYIMQSDGAGNGSWVNPATFGVTSVAVTKPLTTTGSAGAITLGMVWNTTNLKLDSGTSYLNTIQDIATSSSPTFVNVYATSSVIAKNANNPYFQLANAGGSECATFGASIIAGQWSGAAAAGDAVIRAMTGRLLLQTGGGSAGIVVDASNNIGIGVNVPGFKLDVANEMRVGGQGGSDYTLIQGGSGYGSQIYQYNNSGTLVNAFKGNGKSYITASNFGLGNTNPDYALDVTGTGRFTGGLIFPTNVWMTGNGVSNGHTWYVENGHQYWENGISGGSFHWRNNSDADIMSLENDTGNLFAIGTVHGNAAVRAGDTYITSERIEINNYGSGDRYAYIDFRADDTHTDYSLRLLRSPGVNGTGELTHRGTGTFTFQNIEAAAMVFETSDTERMRLQPSERMLHVGEYPTTPPTGTRIATMGNYAVRSLVQNKMITMYNAQGPDCWPQVAEFTLGRYNSTTLNSNPYSRLDISLKDAAGATVAGDVTVMSLQSSGYVGIGTTTPGQKLEVGAGGNIAVGHRWDNGVTTTPVKIGTPGNDGTMTGGSAYLQFQDSATTGVNKGTSLAVYTHNYGIGTAESVRFAANGSVGIGTTTPSQKLEIGGTSSQIYMNSATSNHLVYNANGVAAPTFTTRSAGTKVVFYPEVGASNVDYAMGIEAYTLWHSVPQANASYFHKFYGGTTELMRIQGDGRVGIGTGGAPSAGAFVDIQSTDGGLKLPSMTTVKRDSLSALAGNTVYDNSFGSLAYNNGSGWSLLVSDGYKDYDGTLRVGTSNSNSLILGTNNIAQFVIDASGNIACGPIFASNIAITNPVAKNVVLYTSGTGNWNCPTNCYMVKYTVVGAGAGGNSVGPGTNGAVGGSSGAVCIGYYQTTPGTNYYYNVGAGGTAGNPGGGSQFHTSFIAGGGSVGASTATASGGQWNLNGNSYQAQSMNGWVIGQAGADAPLGFGIGGKANYAAGNFPLYPGNNAQGYCAGGGGACNSNQASGTSGGSGASGFVMIEILNY